MWYSTNYNWKVEIIPELNISWLKILKSILIMDDDEINWNIELSDEYDYLYWKWNEKSNELEKSLNRIIREMKQRWFEFDLDWEFKFQWEEMDDRWFIRKIDWKFQRIEMSIQEWECKCPECWFIFITEK